MTFRFPAVPTAMTLCAVLAAGRAVAQEGDVWTTIGGAALGLYSGAVLGTVGGVMPCGYALNPSSCSTKFAFSGAVVAGAAGAHIGNVDRSGLESLAKTALIGTGVGLVVGAAIKPLMKQHYGIKDVVAVGLIGGAVGASPEGSAIGFGIGLAAGSLLWIGVDGATAQDALQTALLGLAVGGVSGWAAKAFEAGAAMPLLSVSF